MLYLAILKAAAVIEFIVQSPPAPFAWLQVSLDLLQAGVLATATGQALKEAVGVPNVRLQAFSKAESVLINTAGDWTDHSARKQEGEIYPPQIIKDQSICMVADKTIINGNDQLISCKTHPLD